MGSETRRTTQRLLTLRDYLRQRKNREHDVYDWPRAYWVLASHITYELNHRPEWNSW